MSNCNGEPGRAGSVPGLAAGNLLICPGCEVCHGGCETCGGAGRVCRVIPQPRHPDGDAASCPTYRPADE